MSWQLHTYESFDKRFISQPKFLAGIPSIHFIGKKDIGIKGSYPSAAEFEDPLHILFPQGHEVPKYLAREELHRSAEFFVKMYHRVNDHNTSKDILKAFYESLSTSKMIPAVDQHKRLSKL